MGCWWVVGEVGFWEVVREEEDGTWLGLSAIDRGLGIERGCKRERYYDTFEARLKQYGLEHKQILDQFHTL